MLVKELMRSDLWVQNLISVLWFSLLCNFYLQYHIILGRLYVIFLCCTDEWNIQFQGHFIYCPTSWRQHDTYASVCGIHVELYIQYCHQSVSRWIINFYSAGLQRITVTCSSQRPSTYHCNTAGKASCQEYSVSHKIWPQFALTVKSLI